MSSMVGLAAIEKSWHPRNSKRSNDRDSLYLLSAALSPERLGQVARLHWGVENRLH
jgi:predicted transposase YbfD/YdcC